MKVNDNRIQVYLHLVWSTSRRQPFKDAAIEGSLHRCIEAEAKSCGCRVLAVNGTNDHVHVLVTLPTTTPIWMLVKQMKGVSATLANRLTSYAPVFNWQRGYGCFSVSQRDVKQVMNYIARQKQHHATGELWSCEPDAVRLSPVAPATLQRASAP